MFETATLEDDGGAKAPTKPDKAKKREVATKNGVEIIVIYWLWLLDRLYIGSTISCDGCDGDVSVADWLTISKLLRCRAEERLISFLVFSQLEAVESFQSRT